MTPSRSSRAAGDTAAPAGRRVSRLARAGTVVVVVMVLAGATYQGVTTSIERHRYERLGGLVDGGGYQLHIYCTGEGAPTVILEAAAGSMSPAWSLVQPEVGRITRVCSYDRSGLGWSEGDGRYVPSRVPSSLRTLLDQANETGPFVLVGHELGAAFVRLFAARHTGDTAALVLIDDPVAGRHALPHVPMAGAWPWLARIGLLRAAGGLSVEADGLGGRSAGAMRAFFNRPDHLTQAARELLQSDEAVAAARAVTLDRSIMVTSVVTGSHTVPALLVTPEAVTTATRAIATTVARVRGRHDGEDTAVNP